MANKDLAGLIPIDQVTIIQEQIPLEGLWKLRDNAGEYGPYLLEHLVRSVEEHPALFEELEACNLHDELWKDIFDFDQFERRENPEAITVDQVVKERFEHFYLIENGQRSSIFSASEIEQKLLDRDLILTDLISLDGQTWKKIHTFTQFDRRKRRMGKLPKRPSFSSFEQSTLEVLRDLQNNRPMNAKTAAPLIDAARLGHRNTSTPQLGADDQFQRKNKPELEEQNIERERLAQAKVLKFKLFVRSILRKLALIGILGALAVGLLYKDELPFFSELGNRTTPNQKSNQVQSQIPASPRQKTRPRVRKAATKVPTEDARKRKASGAKVPVKAPSAAKNARAKSNVSPPAGTRGLKESDFQSRKDLDQRMRPSTRSAQRSRRPASTEGTPRQLDAPLEGQLDSEMGPEASGYNGDYDLAEDAQAPEDFGPPPEGFEEDLDEGPPPMDDYGPMDEGAEGEFDDLPSAEGPVPFGQDN